MSRNYAEAWEARRLARYRDYVGRNPHYNRTDDGQYHAPKPPRPQQRDYVGGVSGASWFVRLVILLVVLVFVVQTCGLAS